MESSKRRKLLRSASYGSALITLLLPGNDVWGSTGITVEAVNDYSACNGPSLPNSVTDAQGFMSGMTQAGSFYTFSQNWFNNDV